MKRLILLIFCLSSIVSWGQSIKGRVLDAKTKESIPQASITVPGVKGVGTAADLDGNFTFTLPQGKNQITVSFVGYKSKTVTVSNQQNLLVELDPDSAVLEDMVVVGYGTQKKSDITGSVASIKGEDISRQSVGDPIKALQGKIPGVSISSTSGSPGAGSTIRIRGIGTVNNSDPLFVVDGQMVSDINYLNPADIASLEILKDASASAIYGSRGANGVVLVTTKKAESGVTSFTFEAYYGVSQMLNKIDLLDGDQWFDFQTELNKVRVTPLDLTKVNRNVSTDWLKEVTQIAPTQNYFFSISSKKGDISYNASVGYFSQQGNVINSKFDRLTARFSGESKPAKWITTGVNFSLSLSDRQWLLNERNETTGVIGLSIIAEPTVPVRNPDGSFADSPYSDITNPVARATYDTSNNKLLSLLANAFINAEIIKGLELRSSFGIDFRRRDGYSFTPVFYVSPKYSNPESLVSRSHNKYDNWLWETTLSYKKTFGKHSIGAMVGYTMESTRNENLGGTKKGTPNDSDDFWYLDGALNGASATATGTAWEEAMVSFLARVNYNYDDRYLLTATVRTDGSSKFSSQHRFATFPSFAAAWRLSNEKFFKELNADWVNQIKIRAGWGQIGNQNIDRYMYQNLVKAGDQYTYLYGNSEIRYPGMAALNMGNDAVKWETSESTNIGADFTFFKSLNFSAEYYYKLTKDMLVVEPIPLYMGFESGPMANVGSVRNSGFEFSLNWHKNLSSDFSISLGANLATVNNEVVSLGSGNPIDGGSIYMGGWKYATRSMVGSPIGAFYGYEVDRILSTQAELDAYKLLVPGAQLGDRAFKNINGFGADGKTLTGKPDDKLNDADKTVIGSPIPDFTYGFSVNINYKGWDLGAFFEGTQGNQIFNSMKVYTHNTISNSYNKSTAVLNYWTPTNTNTDITALRDKDLADNMRLSDFYVEDGSYLRLKTLQVGYTFPKKWMDKLKVDRMRLYLSAQNLFTITKYTGMDPEVGQSSSSSYMSRGVDSGTYPQQRIFSAGINLNF